MIQDKQAWLKLAELIYLGSKFCALADLCRAQALLGRPEKWGSVIRPMLSSISTVYRRRGTVYESTSP